VRIRAVSVERSSSDGPVVTFESSVGRPSVQCSGSLVPEAGRSYGVELDVDGVVAIGAEVVKVEAGPLGISSVGDTVTITGSVDGVDTDGVAYLRLATDCLLMLETAGGLSPGDHLRISELLGLRWVDFEDATATLTVTGKVIRAAGQGLMRIDDTKTAAGRRTLPLPAFAATVLSARRGSVSRR